MKWHISQSDIFLKDYCLPAGGRWVTVRELDWVSGDCLYILDKILSVLYVDIITNTLNVCTVKYLKNNVWHKKRELHVFCEDLSNLVFEWCSSFFILYALCRCTNNRRHCIMERRWRTCMISTEPTSGIVGMLIKTNSTLQKHWPLERASKKACLQI